jgi:diguanylate cyclase (GGDEF)-like protein/PAS domain S-box-containing protein
VRHGAEDCLQKSDISAPVLQQAVRWAIERSRARAALQGTVTHAEAVLAALADGIVVRDTRGDTVWANPAARHLIQRLDDTSGLAEISERWHPVHLDGRPVDPEDFPSRASLRTGRPVLGSVIGVHQSDGSVAWVEMNSHPLRHGSDGEVFGAVTSLRDVSARIEAERATRFEAALLDAVGQAVVATDPQARVIYWNREATAMFGWTAEESLGQSIMSLAPSERSAQESLDVFETLRGGGAWSGDLLGRRRDGSTFPAFLSATPLHDAAGTVVAVIGVATDLTERKRAEEATQRLSAIVESTGDAVLGKDLDGRILSWNRAAEELYGFDHDDAVGRSVTMLAPEDRLDEIATLLQNVRGGLLVRGFETVRRRRDGSLVEVSLTISPVFDESGAVAGASTIARDITARRELERELEHQALHDALTGLPNRALLTDRLDHALQSSRRSETAVAVMFLDLDNFKHINDAAGHDVGDRVLVEVARRIRDAVGPSDTVARFGGDEFVVICTGVDRLAAQRTADQVLAALAQPVEVTDQPLYVSASVGIALSPPTDADELLRFADAAMYDAKARGRSRAVVFEATLAQDADERLRLSTDLRSAIESDGLTLAYQPVVDLTSGRVVGLEALCRWDHPTLGTVPPDRFITVAEQTGLIASLDRWVLRHVCRDIRRLLDSGIIDADAHVASNISARNISDPSLAVAVRKAVSEAGIPFHALAIEVTETGVMAEPDKACRLLAELRDLGVSIVLDDFGTGYSSLTYLRRLPVNTIKIDRSFVQQMVDDPDDRAIVLSIIDLARSVRLTSIAEGIETIEQLTLLRKLGCDAGQGFLWSPAVPLEQLGELLRSPSGGLSSVVPPPGARTPRRNDRLEATTEHGISRLMHLHHQGASLSTIAAALNRDGFHTPRGQRWHPVSVAREIAQIVRP